MQKRQIIELSLSPLIALHWLYIQVRFDFEYGNTGTYFLSLLTWHVIWAGIYFVIKYWIFRNEPTSEELSLGRKINDSWKAIALFALIKPYYYLLIGGLIIGTIWVLFKMFSAVG